MKPIENRPPVKLPAGANAEERYHAAKTRLLAAQQEKMEATGEFLVARAALRGGLKTPQPTATRATEHDPSGCPAAWAGA